MKQVKIFKYSSEIVLEEAVNEFLADHPVSAEDIQYRMSDDGKYSVIYSAMIVYDPEYGNVDMRVREHHQKEKTKAGETE